MVYVQTVSMAEQNALDPQVSITRERNHLARRIDTVDGDQLLMRLT